MSLPFTILLAVILITAAGSLQTGNGRDQVSRTQCLKDINSMRGKKPELTWDENLSKAAKFHTELMAKGCAPPYPCNGWISLWESVRRNDYSLNGWPGVLIVINAANWEVATQSWKTDAASLTTISGDFKNLGCAKSVSPEDVNLYHWTCLLGTLEVSAKPTQPPQSAQPAKPAEPTKRKCTAQESWDCLRTGNWCSDCE